MTGERDTGASASLTLEQLEARASSLGSSLRPGDRVLLTGPLGSGKTTFVRAVLRELGVTGRIPSPSFIVDAVYLTEQHGTVHHVDLYRLSGTGAELESYGIAELLLEDDGDSVVLLEWADRLPRNMLPRRPVAVTIGFDEDPSRRVLEVVDGRVAGH